MAKREVIKSKQEKALMYVTFSVASLILLYCLTNLHFVVLSCRRVQKFRADYMDLRKEFEQSKLQAENAVRINLLLVPCYVSP